MTSETMAFFIAWLSLFIAQRTLRPLRIDIWGSRSGQKSWFLEDGKWLLESREASPHPQVFAQYHCPATTA